MAMRFVFKVLYNINIPYLILRGVSTLQPTANTFTFIHFTFYCMACGALFHCYKKVTFVIGFIFFVSFLFDFLLICSLRVL